MSSPLREFKSSEIPNIIRDLSDNELEELEYIANHSWTPTGSILGNEKFIRHDLIDRKWVGPLAILGLSKCAINWRGLAVLKFHKYGWEHGDVARMHNEKDP